MKNIDKMSASPSLGLARLQELRIWQGSLDNILQKSPRPESPHGECDKKIAPPKSFDELLEEKLSEDRPVVSNPKPKKPFLKKGEGLARFRMGRNPNRNAITTKLVITKQVTTSKREEAKKEDQEAYLSPLSVPDFVKPRGTWRQVFQQNPAEEETLENYEQFRKSLGGSGEYKAVEELFKTSSDHRFLSSRETVSNGEGERGVKSSPPKDSYRTLLSNDIPQNMKELNQVGDLTMEEIRMQKELKNFETLEQKVTSSSFCSTDPSILNLLASTPQKATEGDYAVIEQSLFSKYIPESIQMKLLEVTKKTDVLQQFLLNLQNMEQTNLRTIDKTQSTNTSFSDEHHRWSTRSPSLTDNYTDCETNEIKVADVAVNTSLEKTLKEVACKECDDLRSKYSSTRTQLSDSKCANAELKSELKSMKKELDKASKEENNLRHRIEEIEAELAAERKRFAKDRAFFQNYVKDNKPSKKERDEIKQLKQELQDSKELQKLKDTKNGATQARLRTQIKQHEKEIAELKTEVEKLQKENAKLTASQKYGRRPAQEVKMLHEINKNLSKLTEQTLVKAPPPPQEPKKCTSLGSDNSTTLYESPVECESVEQQYQTIFGNFAKSPKTNKTVEKTEKTLADGTVEVIYSNGNLKTISADGKTIRMRYFNGDTKETNLNDQVIRYHYAAADSWHVQYPDGTEVMEFKDGHKCTKHVDGRTEVSYPDGSIRSINGDGTEEHTYPDGRRTVKTAQGDQIILLPNGQREVHTEEYKRREYPDGTVRTLHKDGTVETVYANGRVRLKDANGVLIMDTHQS